MFSKAWWVTVNEPHVAITGACDGQTYHCHLSPDAGEFGDKVYILYHFTQKKLGFTLFSF